MTGPRTAPGSEGSNGSRRSTVLGVSLKLYLDVASSVSWAERVAAIARRHPAVEQGTVRMFVLPSLPALTGVRRALADSGIAVGAQDLFWEDRGAYTGAVSGADLRAVGASLVEVGHMERRRHFGEDATTTRRKLSAAFRNDLVPVLCIGERADVGAEAALAECLAQLDSALADSRRAGNVSGVPGVPGDPGAALIVAYEPEWAIGGADSADPEHIDVLSHGIHEHLRRHRWLTSVDVIYGGSAQPGLLPRLGPEVDGLFLGRFAHDPEAVEHLLDELITVS